MELPEMKEFSQRLRDSGKLVLVEGKKDRAALEGLGVRNVASIDKQPLYKVVEAVAARAKKVVILTDLDSEGRKLYGKLRTYLQFHGVEVDNYFREFLFRETKLRQIEGIKPE